MALRKRDLKNHIIKWWINSERKEKQLWTNCEWFLVNFMKKWEIVRYFMKKSFIVWEKIEDVENDYLLLKKIFKNLIPNTVFIDWINKEIFSFSEPVIIDFDILNIKNKSFIKSILDNPVYWEKIKKQLSFFIRKFELLKSEWKILDLFWEENLVFTKNWNIKYIDNYKVFSTNKLIKEESVKKIEYLKVFIK